MKQKYGKKKMGKQVKWGLTPVSSGHWEVVNN